MISVVSQFTCHNESMLIGLFRQRQFADERKWLFVSADVRGAGTRDEPPKNVCVGGYVYVETSNYQNWIREYV